ncbi:hypothetical protein JKG47_00465 [Acidithiobacillus sp. MC6.1]|nr:hypothetical protein [Acidithiobacillus sp. MC6.1]
MRKIHVRDAIVSAIATALLAAVPIAAVAFTVTPPATTTPATSAACSCPTTCDAQSHFNNLAQVNLALAQPPNPSTSFAQGCLGNLDSFSIGSYFSPGSISTLLQNLTRQLMNQACSAVTSTMNNQVSQGNSILNFALNPAALEQNALNGASNTVLQTEQGGLNMGTSTVNNSVGSYVSDAGTYTNDASAASSNPISGNWVNNLY